MVENIRTQITNAQKENMNGVYVVNEMQIRKRDKVNSHSGKT